MELLYKNEHRNCLNYQSGSRPPIEVREMPRGELFKGQTQRGKIVFMLEGELSCSFGSCEDYTLSAEHMLFLPPGYSFILKATSQDRFIMMRLPLKIRFCENYLLENLTRQTRDMEICTQEKTGALPFCLEINQSLLLYTESLLLMGKELCCKYYHETKIKELFYLLRAFYPKEELARFFCHALSIDADFWYFVSQNYHKYNTLAEIAGAMNMTLSGFEKRFRKVFATSAARWINEQKAAKIYHAVSNEETPFKELSMRFGFSSGAAFSDFCKRNLGDSPAKIRKKKQVGGNDELSGGNQ